MTVTRSGGNGEAGGVDMRPLLMNRDIIEQILETTRPSAAQIPTLKLRRCAPRS